MSSSKALRALVLFVLFFATAQAQPHNPPPPGPPQGPSRLRVFIDCTSTWCDQQYIRTEINVVDFLLDRTAADVHVLITSQGVGSGGDQYQLIFFGQNHYAGRLDTLRFSTDPNATDVEVREELVQYIGFGLVPYVMKCGPAGCMKVSLKNTDTSATAASTQTVDPWNYWVFSFGGNGNISADQVYKSFSGSGNINASRVTDSLKVTFGAYYNDNISLFTYTIDDSTYNIRNENNNYSFSHLLVKSLNSHWSLGYVANFNHSTFSNMKYQGFLSPCVEYDVFPYSDVNNRFFTFRYGLDVRYNSYIDTTIYNKMNEALVSQSLVSNISFNQKWGSVSAGFAWSNYLRDFRLNNLSLSTNVNLRIGGGLSVNLGLYGGLTHDQIELPKEGATSEEVLTRQRQLQSGYTMYAYFGINYRFGSKLNNYVNPRFENGMGY